jgi:hypothetical protein
MFSAGNRQNLGREGLGWKRARGVAAESTLALIIKDRWHNIAIR